MKKLYCLAVIAVLVALTFAAVPAQAMRSCYECFGQPPSAPCACPPPYAPIIVTCGGAPAECHPLFPFQPEAGFLAPEPKAECSMFAEPVAVPVSSEDCDESAEAEAATL